MEYQFAPEEGPCLFGFALGAAKGDSTREKSDRELIKIGPKGLRSFDAHDADFFLELLPGPRDREGLPDSLRFWKTRIEETDPDNTFSVGLIYGPSGCGKSSLVKAGLLPRLSPEVLSVYIEATPEETETRLSHGLRKRCPALEGKLSLKETLAALRRGQGIPVGRKVLIVIDQFEQWLHVNKEVDNSDLIQALRQCDGGHVQCIVMVRDDFWMAATRFMRELEVRLVEAQNSAAVDLFPIRHAEKVLTAFGRAFGALPDNWGDASTEQKSFVTQAVAGLAEEGKVISVRLSLFAEMMKGKPWNPEKLEEVGGTEGVGVTFLEETFSASTAPPEHRYHQRAARAVLKALLPDSGTDIKGEMKSRETLLQASGYSDRPKEFDDLIRILDSQLRLITPTDPKGVENSDQESEKSERLRATDRSAHFYQLTHDYLVHSLRDWLTRKQRETRRGRAELLLAERSATWNAKRENRQLPSTVELLRIHALTHRMNWTAPQRTMMRRANRVKGVIWSAALSLIMFTGIGIQQVVSQVQNRTLQRNIQVAVDSLQGAEGKAVPFALDNLDEFPRDLVAAELQTRLSTAVDQQRLSLNYGLARYDRVDIPDIVYALRDANTDPEEMDNVVAALSRDESEALKSITDAAQDTSKASDWPTKARLAIAALHLSDVSLAAEMLRDHAESPSGTFDPIQRTVFIREFAAWSGSVERITSQLQSTEDPALRSGICLSLAGIEKPGPVAKQVWHPLFVDWYSRATESGTHSVAGSAIAQWQLEKPEISAKAQSPKDRDWWHEPNGLTFVKIRAGQVAGEEGPIRVADDFWLSDTEVTVGLFEQFMADEDYSGMKPSDWEGDYVFGNDDNTDLPVQQVSWCDALLFCNWLSWKLALTPCYEIQKRDKTASNGERGEPFTVTWKEDADGIRLPTSAEWKYACRAGTTTEFSFGDDENDLLDYGWFVGNSNSRTQFIRTKLCNSWGLFDMHGNVYEWCWDSQGGSYRVIRGGGWSNTTKDCRSSFVNGLVATYRGSDLGFRVARGPLSQASPASE